MATLTKKQLDQIDLLSGAGKSIPPLRPSTPPQAAPNIGPELQSPGVKPIDATPILTNPAVSKAIELLSGWASLPDAERYSQEQIQNLKNLWKVPGSVAPWTPVEKQEEALQALSTPLETIFRVPTALQKMMFPTEGESRPESAIKALVRPDQVPPGYLGGEISKRMPEPKPGTNLSMMSPRVLTPGLLGALGELLTYEVGLGNLPSRLKKGYQASKLRGAEKELNAIIDQAAPKLVASAEKKGIFPKGWNEADKIGRTKAFLKQKLTENPQVGDVLMKRQGIGKRIFGDLAGERGSAELPGPFKPKPEDITPLIPGAAKNIPKTPTQIEAEKLMKKKADPLIEEAKKYKSAEEFVRNLEYHGTDADLNKIRKEGFKVGPGQKGVSTTQDIEEAKEYGKNVIPILIKQGAEIQGVPGKDFLTGTGSFKPEDIINLPEGITKEQLTSIWNKAHGQPQPEHPELPKSVESILKPGQVKPTVREMTGQKLTPTQMEEKRLLRRELQQEGVASREGFRAGKKEGKAQEKIVQESRRQGIIAGLKDVMERKVETVERKGELKLLKEDIKNRDVLRVKKELASYVKESLPKEAQGNFLKAVANVKTGGQLSEQFRRVDKEVQNIERKDILEGIKSTAKKISETRRIDVENQKQILEIFNEIDFTKRRPETLDKLRKMKSVFDKKMELGQEMEIPNRIWKKLEILLRRPAGDIKVAELKNIKEEMETLEQVGRTKLRVRESVYNLQKEKRTKSVIEGAVPLEKNPMIERQPGETLDIKDNFKNVLSTVNNQAARLDIVSTPMDSFFDLLDGGKQTFDGPVFRTFKQSVDSDFQGFLRDSSADKKRLFDMFKELKLTQQDSEIMAVYAAKIREHGAEKLIETGVKQKTIDTAKLSEKTEKMYKLWRKISDELKPKIAKVMREEWNLPFEEVENYFPFTTDWEKMSDVEIFNRFGKDFSDKSLLEESGRGRVGKKVKFSFMEKARGGKQKIQLDFLDVALKHIDNAHYMINMSRTLRMLKEMSDNPDIEKSLGEMGSSFTKEWLDLLIKKGGRLGDQQIAVLDMLRTNYGLVRLGFNISTGIIQMTAVMDGAMILGNDAFSGINDIILSPESREFVLNNMPEVKERAGDDPAYMDFSKIPILKQGQKISYDHIKFFDRLAAMGVAMGAYRQNLRSRKIEFDYASPDKEAIDYAQQIMRRTQASSLFKDTPPSLRGSLTGNRSVDRFINQFQTFMLNRWNNIRNYTWRAKILGGRGRDKSSRDFKAAFNAMFYLILAVMTEVGIRRGEKRLEKKAVEFFTKGYIPDEKKKSYGSEFIINLLQSVPFVSQGISVAVYGGSIAPSIETVSGLASGPYKMATGKKPETKKRAALETATAYGGLFGAPGLGQIEKTGKMIIDARTKDSVIAMYKEAMRNPDKSDYWNDRADKLAKDLGLSIKRMKKRAEDSIKREESGFVSKLEEKYHGKTDEEFRSIITKMIKNGELSVKGANKINSLRNRRLKDERKMEKEIESQKEPSNRISPDVWKQIEALAK